MSRLTSIVTCAVVLFTVNATAATAATTVRWKDGKITHIGDLGLSRAPTIGRATAAFGAPTKKRLDGKVLCVVDWAPLALRGRFVNLGGPRPGQTTCSSTVGKLQTAEIRGPALQTQDGLRVGDTLARLRKLHPAARRHGKSWWLATAPNPFGDPGARMSIVRANVKDGKVSVLVLWIGAAGE